MSVSFSAQKMVWVSGINIIAAWTCCGYRRSQSEEQYFQALCHFGITDVVRDFSAHGYVQISTSRTIDQTGLMTLSAKHMAKCAASRVLYSSITT